MIVCVCRNLSERQLRAAIRDGADSFDALQFETGCAGTCGRCAEAVGELLAEHGCSATEIRHHQGKELAWAA